MRGFVFGSIYKKMEIASRILYHCRFLYYYSSMYICSSYRSFKQQTQFA